MGSYSRALWLKALCVIALVSASFATHAQTVFAYSSAPGSWVGGGRTRAFTPSDAAFTVTADSAGKDEIRVDIDGVDEYWGLIFSVPKGQTLAPGRHVNAERSAFRTGRSPGLDVHGAGAGCNQVWGSFNIRQVSWNAQGQISAFEADFIQHCESSDSPPIAGVIRWKAAQMSLSLEGPLIGQGIEDDYYGDTSIFELYGDTTEIQYSGSGQRAEWAFLIQAPVGKKLQVGHYVTNESPTASRAGMAINGLSKCWTYTGTLDIKRMTVTADNRVKSLYATFEQRCAGVPGSLKGTIHYGL